MRRVVASPRSPHTSPHLTAVAPLSTSTTPRRPSSHRERLSCGDALRAGLSHSRLVGSNSRGDALALRAGDSADDVSQETPKSGGAGGGAGGLTDRRQAKRGSIAALGAVGGTSTNLAPNQLGASVAGTRTTTTMAPTEKIKKLMAVMDLRGLSDGFLTPATLVIEQGRSVPQARQLLSPAGCLYPSSTACWVLAPLLLCLLSAYIRAHRRASSSLAGCLFGSSSEWFIPPPHPRRRRRVTR